MQPWILENVTVTDKLLLTSQGTMEIQSSAATRGHLITALTNSSPRLKSSFVCLTRPVSLPPPLHQIPFLRPKGRQWNFPLQTSQRAKAQVHQRGFCFLLWCVRLMRPALAFIFPSFFFFAPRPAVMPGAIYFPSANRKWMAITCKEM